MLGDEQLNFFMTQVPIISKPVYWFAEQINGQVFIRQDICHKRVNALLLLCIHLDIFLDYDNLINIYAS